MKRRIIITLFILVGLSAIPLMFGIFYLYTDEISKQDIDMDEVVSVQQTRKFLIDSINNQPIGVIKSTIYFQENNSRIIAYDTEYFTAAFRTLFPLYKDPWDPNNLQSVTNSFNIKDINLIQLDSATTHLLNKDFLRQLITEELKNENIDSRFDFALYNAFTTEFVVEPTDVKEKDILNSEFVFLLKYNEKVSSPHYLIIQFPTVRGIVFKRMSNIIILILVFFIITFTVAFVALYSLYRQKKTSEVTNDFINNVTHEFKTPIATISLACEVLADPTMLEDKDIRSSYVEIINDENNRLKDMVTTVLETAQLRKGQIKMNVELIDMHVGQLLQRYFDGGTERGQLPYFRRPHPSHQQHHESDRKRHQILHRQPRNIGEHPVGREILCHFRVRQRYRHPAEIHHQDFRQFLPRSAR